MGCKDGKIVVICARISANGISMRLSMCSMSVFVAVSARESTGNDTRIAPTVHMSITILVSLQRVDIFRCASLGLFSMLHTPTFRRGEWDPSYHLRLSNSRAHRTWDRNRIEYSSSRCLVPHRNGASERMRRKCTVWRHRFGRCTNERDHSIALRGVNALCEWFVCVCGNHFPCDRREMNDFLGWH